MLTQNEEAFRALDYGADDFDLPIEDEVTQKAGAHIDLDLEGLLEVPRRLGYRVEYRRAERPAAFEASASAALTRYLAVPVDDREREGIELVPARDAVEALPRAPRVVDRDLARAVERAGCDDANERTLERPAGERRAHDLVVASGEDQRQRRRSVAQVGAGDLAGLDRVAGTVEDVVDDLERDPEQPAVVAAAAAEQARRLEQLARS